MADRGAPRATVAGPSGDRRGGARDRHVAAERRRARDHRARAGAAGALLRTRGISAAGAQHLGGSVPGGASVTGRADRRPAVRGSGTGGMPGGPTAARQRAELADPAGTAEAGPRDPIATE